MQNKLARYGIFGPPGAALILAIAVWVSLPPQSPRRDDAVIAAVAPRLLPVAQSDDEGARLLLGFVDSSGSYLANVRVHIADQNGATVASIVTDGPWLDLAVSPGTYDVHAVFDGEARELRDLRLVERGLVTRVISWDLNIPPTQMMARSRARVAA
jgi:hypothetical protein